MIRRSVKAKKPQALPLLLAVIGLSFFAGLSAYGKSALRDTAGFLKKGPDKSHKAWFILAAFPPDKLVPRENGEGARGV